MTSEARCHCGRPLHYENASTEAMVRRIVKERGELVKVTVLDRSFMVPRHYIALHGVRGWELPTLGFEEVKE